MSTSDQVLSWRCTATTRRDSDRNSNVGGTRYTKKIAMAIGPDHGRSSRASAYAAGRLSTKVIATTTRPTHNVFHTKVRNAVFSNRYTTCLRVDGRLYRKGLFSRWYRS